MQLLYFQALITEFKTLTVASESNISSSNMTFQECIKKVYIHVPRTEVRWLFEVCSGQARTGHEVNIFLGVEANFLQEWHQLLFTFFIPKAVK